MKKVFVILSLLSLLVSSCGDRKVLVTLFDIDGYLQDRPDSALKVLDGIDTAALGNFRIRAKYALLYASALDKNYIDTSDLSVIMPAVRYYETHGSLPEKMKAQYYLGRIRYNAGDYPSAIVSLMEAHNYAEQMGDLYWKAMTASAIGNTYNANFTSPEELRYMLESYDLWMEYDDSLHRKLAVMDLARAYHNNRYFDEADSLYRELIRMNPTDYYPYVEMGENEIMRENPDSRKAVAYYETAIEAGEALTVRNYYGYAYALSLAGEAEKCRSLLSRLENYPSDLHSDYERYRIARNEKDYDRAMDYLDAYSQESNTITRNHLEQSVFKSQSDHYRMKATMAEAQRQISNLWILVSALAGLCLAGVILYFSKRRRVALAREKEYMVSLYDESQRMLERIRIQDELDKKHDAETIRTLDDKLRNLRCSFARSYQSQFQAIAASFDLGPKKKTSFSSSSEIEGIYKKRMDAFLSAIKNGVASHRELERMIDEELDGIVSKLRRDYPKLSEEDILLLCYMIIGFDNTTRSLLMDTTIGAMYTRKSRLLKHISSRPSPNLDLYLAFLNPSEWE